MRTEATDRARDQIASEINAARTLILANPEDDLTHFVGLAMDYPCDLEYRVLDTGDIEILWEGGRRKLTGNELIAVAWYLE